MAPRLPDAPHRRRLRPHRPADRSAAPDRPIVRSAFVLVAGVPGLRGVGITLYRATWALTPPTPDNPSRLDRVMAAIGKRFGGGHVDDELDEIEQDIPFR